MRRFIILFNDGDMRVADDEWELVANESHAVVREIKAAGAWLFGGGFFEDKPVVVDETGAGAVEMMRTLKRALDPKNIMNPGKIFSI